MNINTLNRTLVLLKRLADTATSTKAIISTEPQKPPVKYSEVEQPFPRATPESQGVSSNNIVAFVKELQSHRELEMQNLLILRNGKIIYENSFGAHDYHLWKNTYSQCKTITGLAIGFLYDEGKISPQDRVVDILGDIVPFSSRLKFKNLTVEHLLTMRSTVTFNEASSMTTTEWAKGFFNSATSGEIGVTFNYNSLNSYMLSYIVKVITGENLSSYLDKKLFDPLGITEYFWEKCPKEIEKGGWGLYIRPEDIAKIGQLVLNKGIWNGQQLISRDWLSQAVKPHCPTPSDFGKYDYGYHLWMRPENNSFLFNGMLSQNVMGFMDSGILIVSNAAVAEMFQQSDYYDIACRHLGGSFPTMLAEDSTALRKLHPDQGFIRKMFNFKAKNREIYDFFKQLENKAYVVDKAPSVGLLPAFLQIVQNNYTKGTKAIEFKKQDGQPILVYHEEDEKHTLPIGFDRPLVSDLSFHGEPYRVAVSGNYAENEDGISVFKISVAFVETPCTRVLKFYYDAGGFKMRCLETPGTEFLTRGIKTLAKGWLSKPVIASTISKIDYDFVEYKIYKLFEPKLELREKE